MGQIGSAIGIVSMLIGQAQGISSQYMSMKQQKQMMAQQQALTQRCPNGAIPMVQTVNGQQVLVCPAPANH